MLNSSGNQTKLKQNSPFSTVNAWIVVNQGQEAAMGVGS